MRISCGQLATVWLQRHPTDPLVQRYIRPRQIYSECVEAQRPIRHCTNHSGDDFDLPYDPTNSAKALKEATELQGVRCCHTRLRAVDDDDVDDRHFHTVY